MSDKTKKNDKKRLQYNLKQVLDKEFYQYIWNYAESTLHSLYPDHKLTAPGKLIVSLEGCDKQTFHTDFNSNQKLPSPECGPIVLFIGLSQSSRLDIDTGNELFNKSFRSTQYYSGDIIMINGFLMHRGCSYKEKNLRIFFNASHKDIKQPNLNTVNTFY